MKIYIESKDDIKELQADNRGRVSIGPEFANKNVQLAILDTDDDVDKDD
jgi:hypothetical protein